MTPKKKISLFLTNPSKEYLLTKEEYESLNPYDKGYVNYLQAAWNESPIPQDLNPFDKDSKEYIAFNDGSFHAMQEVQEFEE